MTDNEQYYARVLLELYRVGMAYGQITLAEMALDAVQHVTGQNSRLLKLYAIRQNCLHAGLADIIGKAQNPYISSSLRAGLEVAAQIAQAALDDYQQREKDLKGS